MAWGLVALGLLVSITSRAGAEDLEDRKAALAAMQPGFVALSAGHPEGALEIWRPIAESGFPPAAYAVAVLYEKGRGAPVNLRSALKWFWAAELGGYQRAAKRREALQSRLPEALVAAVASELEAGLKRESLRDGGRSALGLSRLVVAAPGDGTKKAEAGYVWATIAAALGGKDAVAERDRLAATMSVDRLVELQAQAADIFEGRLAVDDGPGGIGGERSTAGAPSAEQASVKDAASARAP